MIIKQSTARTILVGPVLDSTGAAKTDEVVGSIKVTKNGTVGAANGSATLTHDHAGKYKLALTATDCDTVGVLEISLNSGTNDMPVARLCVIEEAVYDAMFAASAAGYQVPIWASAASTVNLSATTVKTLTDAVALPASATIAITGDITGNLSGSVGSVTGLTASNLDATISSRMATYTQPTGFLAATFPATVASTTNITAGTITTTTNLANLPAITANWLTAAGLAADAVTEIQSGLMLAASYTAPPSAATIADSVWDEVQSGHVTAGTFGYYLDSQVSAAGGGSLTAADVWAYGTRVLTAGTNIGTVAANITQVQGQATYADALTYLLTTGYVGVDGDIQVQATGNWSTFDAGVTTVMADVRKWNNSIDGITGYGRIMKVFSTGYSATAAGQTTTNFRADNSGNLEIRTGQTVLIDQVSTDTRQICTVVSVTQNGNDNDIEIYPAMLAACTTGDSLYKLPSASPDSSVADVPTVAEMEARTLVAANYFDPAADTVAHVTLVDTLTTYTGNTPQTGDAYAVVNSGTHGNAALKTLIDAIDTVVDSILADTGTDGVAIAAAVCNKIADHVRRRTQANVEASGDGDTLSVGSLYGAIQQSQESAISGTTQTIYKTDGTTSLGTKTVSKTPSDDPIRGIS